MEWSTQKTQPGVSVPREVSTPNTVYNTYREVPDQVDQYGASPSGMIWWSGNQTGQHDPLLNQGSNNLKKAEPAASVRKGLSHPATVLNTPSNRVSSAGSTISGMTYEIGRVTGTLTTERPLTGVGLLRLDPGGLGYSQNPQVGPTNYPGESQPPLMTNAGPEHTGTNKGASDQHQSRDSPGTRQDGDLNEGVSEVQIPGTVPTSPLAQLRKPLEPLLESRGIKGW